LRVTRSQRAQKIFVIADLQIGMQTTLEENSSAAQLEHFLDLAVDRLERKDVAVFRSKRAVERAERTIFRAEIRVIDVAIDLVRDDARIVFLEPELVRVHPDADEVIGLEHFKSLLFVDRHDLGSFEAALYVLFLVARHFSALFSDRKIQLARFRGDCNCIHLGD
jgi:hypothetical protein